MNQLEPKKCKYCGSGNLLHTSEGFCYFNTQLRNNHPKIDNKFPSEYFVCICVDCGKSTAFAILHGKRQMVTA